MENEWNKKCHRWVNKDAKGIFVLSKDENSPYPFRLVFDVSDTHNAKGTEYKLWSVKPEYEQEIIETLDSTFGAETEENSLAKCINKVSIRNSLCFIITGLTLVTITETIKNQQEEINNLKTEIEEMKSKGE